jgi:hypothetical protein
LYAYEYEKILNLSKFQISTIFKSKQISKTWFARFSGKAAKTNNWDGPVRPILSPLCWEGLVGRHGFGQILLYIAYQRALPRSANGACLMGRPIRRSFVFCFLRFSSVSGITVGFFFGFFGSPILVSFLLVFFGFCG